MFGYFIKFGHQYLSEALFCIAGIMAQHRYSATRAIFYKIREFAKDSEIIMRVIIVGAVAAGMSAAAKLKRMKPEYDV